MKLIFKSPACLLKSGTGNLSNIPEIVFPHSYFTACINAHALLTPHSYLPRLVAIFYGACTYPIVEAAEVISTVDTAGSQPQQITCSW